MKQCLYHYGNIFLDKLFYKNDSDNYMAILLQIIVWLMLIYAEPCDMESLL